MKVSDMIKVLRTGTRKSKNPYSAYIAGINLGEGSTGIEAISDCVENLHKQIKHMFTRHVRWTNDGSVWILEYRSGWSYVILHPGNKMGCSCILGMETEHEALVAMERHIAQYDENTHTKPTAEVKTGDLCID